MSQSGGSEKAYFTHDDYGSVFYVQFNPKEFKVDEAVAWKDSKEFHVWKPLIEFDRGKPSALAMELIFDTTDTGEDVNSKWIDKLRQFLSVNVISFKNKKFTLRAPHCSFCWAGFTFPGVVESISVSYLMFKTDGTPLRAKVSIKMKERHEDWNFGSTGTVTLAAPTSMLRGGGSATQRQAAAAISAKGKGPADADAVPGLSDTYTATTQATGFTGCRTHTVQEGETLSGIALEFGIDFRLLCLANQIDDPMNCPPGTPLVLPGNAQEGAVFAHLPSDGNWNWSDYDPQLNEDSDLADIFSIYDGSWDPFAEQDLEALGGEVGMAGEEGAAQASGAWAMSEYEGTPPDASTFEHGESGSSDIFSLFGGATGGDKSESEEA